MTKKRVWSIISATVSVIIIFYGCLWIYAEIIRPRQKAYFLPTSTTLTYQGSTVRVSCHRDADCELINPEADYRTCFPRIYCGPSGPSTRAVNATAWASLAKKNNFVDSSLCQQEDEKQYPGIADTMCTGGIVAEARCSFGKCIAIQLVP